MSIKSNTKISVVCYNMLNKGEKMTRPLSTSKNTINLEKIEPYLNSFKEVEDDDAVKNIALMGSYGSGKSTILSELKKQNPKKYITVNMIEFSESSSKLDTNKDNNDNTTSRQLVDAEFSRQEKIEKVERSIIQQLIYQEPQKTIPFSKIKKEQPTKFTIACNMTMGIIFALLTTIFISFNYFGYIIGFDVKSAMSWISLAFYVVIVAIGLYLLFKIIYYFYKNFRISKINFSKNNTSIECEKYESIYNRFLDEIIYFFKETTYDTVIFEDIDRYDDLLFFSHLRELNTLLNNSKYLNKKIKFIYAIRDDLFVKEDKHKFFDFIIPVIPIIDFTNSFYKFREFLPKNEVSDDILKPLSLYVSDLRVLTNICNEYEMYSNINKNQFKKENLLAVLVLKNLYPKEFSKLQYNDSIIDKIFKKKDKLIEEIINKKKERLEHLTQALKEEQYCLDPKWTMISIIKDLVVKALNELDWYRRGSGYAFKITGLTNNYSQPDQFFLKSDVKWDELKDIDYITISPLYAHTFQSFSIEIPEIIKERIEQLYNLHLNKEKVSDKSKQDIMDEIDSLESEINSYNNIKPNKLFQEKPEELDSILNGNSKDEKLNQLLKFLIMTDLLNENYSYYISRAYQTSENENDLKFINNCYSKIQNGFKDKLFNVDYIYQELKNSLYESPYAFNFDIIKYFAKNNVNNLKNLLRTNKNNLRELYINLEPTDEDFNIIAITMCQVQPEIIKIIFSEGDNFKQYNWLRLIVCLNNSDFKNLKLDETHKSLISNFDLIKFSKISNSQINNLVENLEMYSLKFKNISGCEQNKDLFIAIKNESLYEFNFNNLSILNKSLNFQQLKENEYVYQNIKDNIELFVDILIKNNIQTEQGEEFNKLINTTITEEKLIDYYKIKPTLIEDVSYVKYESVNITICNCEGNIICVLKKKDLSDNAKIKILSEIKNDFIKANTDEIFEIIKTNNLFNQELLYKQTYCALMPFLLQKDKDYLLNKILDIIDENNILRILKLYDSQFKKTKNNVVLQKNTLNEKIVAKLKNFDLYVVSETEESYIFTKKDKPPKLI